MTQTYNPVFNPDDTVQSTMNDVFNNFSALRSKFSGTSAPGSPVDYQWWADTTSNILKFYAGGSWRDVYDFTAHELIIKDDQIISAMISSSARKGTIVQGEDIAPATCSIKAATAAQSMPWAPKGTAPLGSSTSTSFETIHSGRIYVQSAATLYMMVMLHKSLTGGSVESQWVLGTVTSSTVTVTSQTPAWASIDASASTASLSTGWHDVFIKIRMVSGADPVYLDSYTFRWGV